MTTPPLSACRRAGDLLLVSGQLGISDGSLVEGGIAAETRQTILNVEAVLAEHGASLNHIVKSTVYLASMAEWAEMNEVYAEMLGAPYPARSAIGAELIGGARVEIEVVGYLPHTESH